MSKFTVTVELSGCDDHTTFNLDVTDDQSKFLRMVSALSRRNSEYGCQPVIEVKAAS